MSKYQQIVETGEANTFLGNSMSSEANLCGAGNPCTLQEPTLNHNAPIHGLVPLDLRISRGFAQMFLEALDFQKHFRDYIVPHYTEESLWEKWLTLGHIGNHW